MYFFCIYIFLLYVLCLYMYTCFVYKLIIYVIFFYTIHDSIIRRNTRPYHPTQYTTLLSEICEFLTYICFFYKITCTGNFTKLKLSSTVLSTLRARICARIYLISLLFIVSYIFCILL